jgi:hypothetical protein
MTLARIYQPRNPQFWLLVILNGLSSVIGYLLQRYEFPVWIMLALVVFAIGNMVFGLRIAVLLMKTPTSP